VSDDERAELAHNFAENEGLTARQERELAEFLARFEARVRREVWAGIE
jgi:hypothetical protein